MGSVIVLRYKRPELKRPYKVWGYPLVPLLFVLIHLWIVWGSVKEKPFESLVGVVIVAIGIPIYFVWKTLGSGAKAEFRFKIVRESLEPLVLQ